MASPTMTEQNDTFEDRNGAGDNELNVADIKAKNKLNGDHTAVSNHIGESMRNGHVSSHEKESHSKSKHETPSKHEGSSSKHHSSSSKHSSSHSSSSKHRDGSSSSSKHHSSSGSSSKHGSSSSKHRDGHSSSSSKGKEGSSSSSSHKHSSSSSSSKHKEGSSSSSSKSKEGHSSSSSHSKEKSHGSSSSSENKHRDRPKEGEKHKSSSSSGSGDKHRDKHRESSSSSSKHKESSSKSEHSEKRRGEGDEKRKEKHKENKENRAERHKETDNVQKEDIKKESMEVDVKSEPTSPVKRERSPVKSHKDEAMSDDDVPLSKRIKQEKPVKREVQPESDDEDDQPLSSRIDKTKKIKKEKDTKKPKKRKSSAYEDSEDEKPLKKKKKVTPATKEEKASPTKRKKKQEEKQEIWKWWEEERRDDGVKWKFLEHKGVVFAPEYEPLPDDVKFYYDGKHMKLSLETEEVATFYGRMLDHDYTTKDVFNKNFFKDWRKVMTVKEKDKITDLKKCNFKEIDAYFKRKSEERKARSKQEKLIEKEKNEAIMAEYGTCSMDGHKEKIGNFRIEPPGLFRGRGDHPKQGMLKRRTMPEDVIINCSKDSAIPQPPPGHKWKEVRHDNSVSWLASWAENIQGQIKYVMLNASSRLKGEKDWQKYETARRLYKCVDSIREGYRNDWKSKEMRIRQRAVALYFIDKLALRAGNEKDEGETADTVGCCSLRVEHLKLHEKYDDQEFVVEFDFLGKDSIRYYNRIPVEKRVFKNLQLFMENKQPGDDLFDRLNTAILNKHLHDLMEGLTAKVFRTFNASKTLQEQLNLLTDPDDPVPAKFLSYNRANRAVAVLCNHQRAAPKNFDKQMENIQNKIDAKKDSIKEAKKGVKDAKADYKAMKSERTKQMVDKKKKTV